MTTGWEPDPYDMRDNKHKMPSNIGLLLGS
ncbi:hypothetical protein CCACVL1_12444 [Corchorus capsularis]|uniref:Uncharacterized protein n=1 Tax=Corchorus capsularis TaxID=210143 RepID=A0A1R3IFJ3_COCAP|nr:hypothetical protein CCACVL1_12444 [Corchorus capsularis]